MDPEPEENTDIVEGKENNCGGMGIFTVGRRPRKTK
jgi:hypothetical protein